MKIPKWGSVPLESSLPHIIVDEFGRQAVERTFKSRSAATRQLNLLLAGDQRMTHRRGWRVQPKTD